jgi:hypothetical protein
MEMEISVPVWSLFELHLASFSSCEVRMLSSQRNPPNLAMRALATLPVNTGALETCGDLDFSAVMEYMEVASSKKDSSRFTTG